MPVAMAGTTAALRAPTADELIGRVLYRDALMLVIDKPPGIPVHAGPRGGPNLEALFGALRFGLPHPPALAHRLDRDTSGCLILGRHRKALARLGRLFAAGAIIKTYWAIVEGEPLASVGRIELPLKKLTLKSGWRVIGDASGQAAVTDWRTLAAAGGHALIEAQPRTGRTHQIRVHLASLNHPILGDTSYGSNTADKDEPAFLHLHARAVEVPLYPKRPPVRIEAPLPAPIARTLRRLGLRPPE